MSNCIKSHVLFNPYIAMLVKSVLKTVIQKVKEVEKLFRAAIFLFKFNPFAVTQG